MTKIEQILQEVRNELGPDFVSTDVVGLDGLSICGMAADPSFDNSAASARFAMVMKLASKVSDKLGLGKLEDNLASTDNTMVITRFLGDGSYYWGLSVTRDATLGSVRMMMNEHAPQLWEAIPH